MKRALLVVVLAVAGGCVKPTPAERFDARGRVERKPERAIGDFTQAIELEPGRAEFWLHRGDARARQGDVDGAIADYSESLRLQASAITYLHRARARARKQMNELALVDLGAALELAPKLKPAYRERAKVRAAMGDAEGAKEDEDKLAALEDE